MFILFTVVSTIVVMAKQWIFVNSPYRKSPSTPTLGVTGDMEFVPTSSLAL